MKYWSLALGGRVISRIEMEAMPEPEDTFDKLIENMENTTIKMVEKELVFRFQDLEEVVIRITQDQEDSIPKLRVKEDIFKTETINAWEALQSCQSE